MLVADLHATTLLETEILLIAVPSGWIWTIVCVLANPEPSTALRVHIFRIDDAMPLPVTQQELLIAGALLHRRQ